MSETPTDRKYSKSHEWFLTDGDVVTLGITQFAADELTDITFVEPQPVGTQIEAGQPCAEVESVKATADVFSAVTGEIVETNEALADAPELLNNDPFGEGWILRIRSSDLAPLDALMDATAYDAMLAES